MNKLKITAAALTSWLAIGMYSAPAFSATMLNATGADFQFELGQAGITTANNRHIDANALDASTDTFRSLGQGGAGVFSFGSAFSGTVTIWETTFTSAANYPETVDVYVGNTWSNDFSALPSTAVSFGSWTSLGTLSNIVAYGTNGGTLNTGSGTFQYLLLIDRSSTPDGFDVAKVSVSAVPLPGAAWLFGSALLGMIGLSRRNSSKNT